MSIFERLSEWLPWVRTRRGDELAEELRTHLAMAEADRVARGEQPADAAANARREFGNTALVRELSQDQWRGPGFWFERLSQDVRFALRMLRRSPVFTAVAVACLALGIGANAAVRSWTEGIVHHPFPGVREQDRLVAIAGTVKGSVEDDEMSWPDFIDLSHGTTAFDAFFVSKITGATLTGGDRAERLVGQLVTANYFDAIGVRPMLGRGFLPGEDVGRGAHPVTVISYRLWRDHFGSNPQIVGSTINYNSAPHTIVGVTPPEFLGTFVGYAMQFWVPASQQAVFDPSGYKLDDRSARWVEGFARLSPGISVSAGQAEVNVVARRLEAQFANDDRGRGVRIFPLDQNPFDNAKTLEPMLRVGSIVAGVLLVIVCANIANLLLVRALARGPELTVRHALGASRGRLIRQLVTEGVILAAIGTVAGLFVAYISRNTLGLFFAPRGGVNLVFGADYDWTVVGATVALGLGSTTLFALIPALHSTRADLAFALRAAAPGAIRGGQRGRLRAAIVLVQISLGVVLLIGSGLAIRSLRGLLRANPGFSSARVTTGGINLFVAGYDTARAHRFEDDLLRRVRAIERIGAAAFATNLPFSTRPYDNGPIAVDGYAPSRDERPTADYNAVTPGYFATLGIPLRVGRDFAASDADTSAPVAIVSRAMGERYWPNTSPIGRRLQLRGTWMRVVGIVSDIKYRSLTQPASMLFYVPLAQQRSTAVSLFFRPDGTNAVRVVPAVVAAIHEVDPNVSPYEFVTLREQIDRSTSGQQIMVTLLTLFGTVALCLAVLGLYGVISYVVSQSTRELGVRLALGATPSQLLALVVSSGLRLALTGVALGILTALVTTRLLGDLLFEVSPRDPVVFGSVIAVMIGASLASCLLPAWRASRLDPTRALRA